MSKKKILIISPYLPTLDEGGRIRLFNSIKYISDYFDVHLVCFIYSEKEVVDAYRIKRYCNKLDLIYKRHQNRKKDIISKLFRVILMPPDLITKRFSSEMENKVNEILKNNKFDIIQCLHQYTVQYIPKNIKIPTVLVEHNIESEIFKRSFDYKLDKGVLHISKYSFRNNLEIKKLRRYELKSWKRMEHIITVSEVDKKLLLKRFNHPSVTVIPNGVDLNYFKPKDLKQDNSIIFTGTFSHQPNLDALLFFYNIILPIVKKKIKNIKVVVAGKNLPEKVNDYLSKDPNMEITGYVDDIRPYIDRAILFIAPIRIGSGTRLKILQALAMKKCIVSTEIGCEGIEVENDYSIVIRNMPNQFADAIFELYNNKEKREFIAQNGYKVAIEKYKWENIFSGQIKLYREIIND